MRNGHHFNDPEWRSPLTGSTKAQILEMHKVNMEIIHWCNVEIRKVHAKREEEYQLMKAIEAEEKAAKQAAREEAHVSTASKV